MPVPGVGASVKAAPTMAALSSDPTLRDLHVPENWRRIMYKKAWRAFLSAQRRRRSAPRRVTQLLMQSSKPIHHPRISPELAAALAALATLALIYFAWPVYRAFLPLQIDINEAWNAYQTDMLRAGQSLYSSNDFITNNYPPLSFYVVNALSAATGIDVLYVGRLLSLAATVAIAFSVWACVRRLGASRFPLEPE